MIMWRWSVKSVDMLSEDCLVLVFISLILHFVKFVVEWKCIFLTLNFLMKYFKDKQTNRHMAMKEVFCEREINYLRRRHMEWDYENLTIWRKICRWYCAIPYVLLFTKFLGCGDKRLPIKPVWQKCWWSLMHYGKMGEKCAYYSFVREYIVLARYKYKIRYILCIRHETMRVV